MTTETAPLLTPADLKARGSAYWRKIADDYELTDSENELLLEACRTLDNLDALAAIVAADGVTTLGSTGQLVAHPALTEARQQRVVLHRLLAALDLPDEAIPSGVHLRTVAGGRANAARSKAN